MVKKIFIALALVFTISLVGCQKVYSYDDFSSQFITNTAEQTTIQNGTYYIYMYGPTCEHCIEVKQEVLSTIDKIKKYSIYLVSVSSLNDVNSDILAYSNDDIYTPSLVKISNHEVAHIYVGGTEVINALNSLLS